MNEDVLSASGASRCWLQVVIATAESPEKCVPALTRIWPDLISGVGVLVLSGVACATTEDLVRRFPGLRIHHHAGESVWHLRQRVGGLIAGSEWLALLEDHNLPQPGWLTGLLSQVRGVDDRVMAIFGATCNQTSVGTWDWANYLSVLVFHWAPLASLAVHPLVFNSVVRVASLPAPPWWLGTLEQTIPSLALRGRMSEEFVVDHIQYRSFPSVLGYHFANGRATGASLRTQVRCPVGLLARHLAHVLVVRPWRSRQVMRQHPQRHQLPRGTGWRLATLLAAHACGALVGFMAGPGKSMWQLE